MMKSFPLLTRALCAAGMLWALGSCGDSKTDEGGGPAPTIKEIAITISDPTSTSAKVSYAPSASNLGYYDSIMEKSEFDKLADDNACIQFIIDNLKAQASSQSKPLKDIINANTKKGNQTHIFDNLASGKEYVVYAVGINTDGTASSALFKKNFTLSAPVIEQIKIKVSDITTNSASISFTPSVDYLTYFPSIIEKIEFDKFADDAAYIQDDIEFLELMAAQDGTTLEEIIRKYTKKGPQSHVYDKLDAGKEYVVYAFGLNVDATVTSALFKEVFTVKIPGPSNNKLTIKVSEVGSDGAILSTTATNEDPYILDVWEASELKGMTDEQIMDKVINGYEDPNYWEDYISKGNDELSVQGRLTPETDYIALAFGYQQGVKTTALVKEPFTTKSGGWIACTFTITPESVNSRIATYKITPSDTTVPYYCSLISASKIADESDETALAELQKVIQKKIDDGWKYDRLLFRGVQSQTYKDLLPKTDYYLCIVGMTTTGEIITDFIKQKISIPDASTASVVFGTPQISGRSVTVPVTPGANTPKWKACWVNVYSWSTPYTDEYMTSHILKLADENQMSLTATVFEDCDAAYFYGIGFDASGNPGQIVKLVVPVQ